ncbi:MAG: hypothetical protein U0793_22980 [Gemmataceae bacterium]
MAAQLRVFPGSLEETNASVQAPSVRVRLGDLMPLLNLARRNNYLWLEDFIEDEVKITPDLYEVIRAFGAMRPSA